jgi:hypothetical protein
VPDARLNIDATCLAAQDDGTGDLAGVVKREKRQFRSPRRTGKFVSKTLLNPNAQAFVDR